MSWQQLPDMDDWAANKDLVVDGKVRAALAAVTMSQWHSTPERRQQGKRQDLSPGLQEPLRFFRDLLGNITVNTTLKCPGMLVDIQGSSPSSRKVQSNT